MPTVHDDSDATDIIMSESHDTKGMKRMHSSDAATDADDESAVVVLKKPRGRPPKVASEVFPVSKRAKKSKQKAGSSKGNKDSDKPGVCDAGVQTDFSLFCSLCSFNHSTTRGQSSDDVNVQAANSKELRDSIATCVKAQLVPVALQFDNLQQNIQREMDEMKAMKTAVEKFAATLSAFAESNSAGDLHIDWSSAPNDADQQEAGFAPAAAANHRGRRQAQRHAELKRDVVASMYVDMDLKQRRAKNIIVSGVPYGYDDFSYVTNLLAEEFNLHYIPTVSCRRIGKQVDGRVQLLLVTLESRQDADYFVANAKMLRKSHDPVVKCNVFISADLTPAEAKAAYDIRCRRRQMNERNQHTENLSLSGPSGSAGGSRGDGRH